MSKYIAVGASGFALGVVAGFALGYYLTMDRLEVEYQNELAKVKEKFEKRNNKDDKTSLLNDFVPRKAPKGIYLPEDDDNVEENEDDVEDFPYIIQPNQFYYEQTDFKKVELFYYKLDHIFCDNENNPIPNNTLYDLIGDEFTEDLEANAMVFIRNERKKSDFVINLLQDKFTKEGEVPKKKSNKRKSPPKEQ